MSCTLFKCVLVQSALCLSVTAFAQQDDVVSQRTSNSAAVHPVSVEVKPLPTLLSIIPGVGGVGLAGEVLTGKETSVYAEANYLDSDLSGRGKSEARKRAGSGLYPDKVRLVTIDVGGRFYTSPYNSSWYGGAKVGYSTIRGDWLYHDATVDQKTASLTPGINAGYRWKFDNAMLVRVGAGASANLVQFQRVDRPDDSEDSKDAQSKLDKLAHAPILANLDLGLGYIF